MDIIFKCPLCEQELEVDADGAGTKIECPACSETITVPEPGEAETETPVTPPPPPPPPKHFVVPVGSAPAAALITKPMRPLDVAAKESDKKLRIKTFKHTECVEVGHDRFDEIVSGFLDRVGQANIVSINPITYSTIDSGTHQPMSDFGVVIVFRG